MTREEYTSRRAELLNQAQAALNDNNFEECSRLRTAVEQLDTTFEQSAREQANLNALMEPSGAMLNMASVSHSVAGTVVESGNAGGNPTDTYEYAFMNFVCRGTPIPSKFLNENQSTTTTTASAVIPKTLLHEIIRQLKTSGNIYSRVRKLNVQGGVEIPILSVVPTASWVGETASETKSVTANTKVTFTYYGLECKIAQSILSNVVSLEEFNDLFVPLCVEAIIVALETAIISGSGSGQPLGILNDTRVPAANTITMAANTDMLSWEAWKKKVFAKMKKAYRNGVFIMAQGTFDGYIDGMVDSVGQPIGRVNYGMENGEVYRFGGKTVETVEDSLITPFDSASTGDVIAIFVDLNNYAINSNMQLTTTKWTDHDTNQEKTKVMMLCDGKLLDPNGVLIIKKGAAVQSGS